MEEKEIKEPCPFKNSVEIEQEAFRWGFSPIESEYNFLPNYIYNEKMNIPPRVNSQDDLFKCGNCALSMFKTFDIAKSKWNNELQQRNRDLLKYTHVLKGTISKEMGVSPDAKKPHFNFFEYEGVELKKHFIIADFL